MSNLFLTSIKGVFCEFVNFINRLPCIYVFNIKINILAQVFGLIGLIFVVIAYQKNDKLSFLKFCNLQFCFTILESLLLLAYTSVFKIGSGIFRNLVVAHYLKTNKKMPKIWNLIFILMVVVPSMFFINSWVAYLPIFSSIVSTLVTCQNNFKLLKCGGIVVEIISMTHSLFIGAYVGFIRQSIILIAIIIGLIKYIKYEKNQKYYFIG